MPHHTLDVFTATPFLGNPLAVVQGEVLGDARMQAVAREFNLSETVFVFAPADPRHRAAIRIFTPAAELPFAGHPTIGTAALLALLDRDAGKAQGPQAFGLELKVGIVACLVEPVGPRTARARFRLPRLPAFLGDGPAPDACAAALGLDPAEIGCGRFGVARHDAGVPYDCVPVAGLDALARAAPREPLFSQTFRGSHPSAYVYTETAPGRFRARMFAPGLGVAEDPATGSAAAAFAGVLMQFSPMGEGVHDVEIVQGVEMGRESRIGLQLAIQSGALAGVEIAGEAVIVSEGRMFL